MALGSSAPEILLAVIETAGNLGGCPGELGASTIVGSAAFNLLVITAACIYSVNESTDTDPDRDETVPKGAKKIYDTRVFAVTAFSSVWAYVWLYLVLRDQMVDSVEAWLTLSFFFVLVGLAFGFDKYTAMQADKEKSAKGLLETDAPPVIEYSAVEVYRELIEDKKGMAPTDEEGVVKRNKMKSYVKETMKTD